MRLPECGQSFWRLLALPQFGRRIYVGRLFVIGNCAKKLLFLCGSRNIGFCNYFSSRSPERWLNQISLENLMILKKENISIPRCI